MTIMKLKGHDIDISPIKDSFSRRAQQFTNKIKESLRKIGIVEDDIMVDEEPFAIKRIPASVTWYYNEFYMHYSFNRAGRFVDNLQVISKVLEAEVNEVLNEEKTMDEFCRGFSEDKDVNEQRKQARITLGLDEDCEDIALIDTTYKKLAKQAHPDMEGGSLERFKEINKAHKILKKELT